MSQSINEAQSLNTNDIDAALSTLSKSMEDAGIEAGLTSPELSKAVAEPVAKDESDKIGSGKVSKRAMGGETQKQEDFSSEIGTGTVPAAGRKGNWATTHPEGGKQDVDEVANSEAAKGYKRGLSKAVKKSKDSSSVDSVSKSKSNTDDSSSYLGKAVTKSSAQFSSEEPKANDKSEESDPNPSGVSVGDSSSYGVGSSELRGRKNIAAKAKKVLTKSIKHLRKSLEDGSEREIVASSKYLDQAAELLKKSNDSEALGRVERAQRYLVKALKANKEENFEANFNYMTEAKNSLKKAISSESKPLSKSISDMVKTDKDAKKVLEVSPLLKSLVAKISESNLDLKKSLDSRNEEISHMTRKLRKSLELNKSLSENVDKLTERIDKVEKAPLVRKSVASVAVIASPNDGASTEQTLTKRQVGDLLVKGVEKGLLGQIAALSFDDRMGNTDAIPEEILQKALEIQKSL